MRLDNRACAPQSQPSSSTYGSGVMPATIDIQGDGQLDPRTPDRLSGRTQERDGNTTRTLTWDLQRR
jgi:hypothetical protein